MPVAPGFWIVGPSDQVARRGPAASSRAQGKVPAIQEELPSPAKMDEKLAHQLQAEELAAEKACQGRDVATLEVVMEAANPLMWGQV